MVLWPAAADNAVGPSAQIDVDVVEITHDVLIGAERRHDEVLRSRYVRSPSDDSRREVVVTHGLQRVGEVWAKARSCAVWAVAHFTGSVKAAEPGKRVPIDGSVRRYFVRRIALCVEIQAIDVSIGTEL